MTAGFGIKKKTSSDVIGYKKKSTATVLTASTRAGLRDDLLSGFSTFPVSPSFIFWSAECHRHRQFQEWPFRERKSGPHVAFIFSAADEQKALWLVSPNVSRGDKSNIDPPSLRGLRLPTANF